MRRLIGVHHHVRATIALPVGAALRSALGLLIPTKASWLCAATRARPESSADSQWKLDAVLATTMRCSASSYVAISSPPGHWDVAGQKFGTHRLEGRSCDTWALSRRIALCACDIVCTRGRDDRVLSGVVAV
ncbi:hypothetical protein HG530_012286 [Fusarium avenaceum]|nr:hypothetical protein HG530_012286 [Fusarium avenaceum]